MPDELSHQDSYKVYTWDEVSCELAEYEVRIPDGVTPRQAMILADDQIQQQCGTDEMGIYSKKVRQEGDVFVLDALFGRDKITRLYYCPEDTAQAKRLAKKELKREFR